jgi:tetratricopeptide (TPR) repeat protein
MSELLINRLSVLPGLIVAPLSSVIAYGDSGQDPLAAGRELGVEAVLDGHVQMRDGRIRLTARLLDTRTGASLWAGEFTETLNDFFAVQDSLAGQLANELVPNLPSAVRRRTLQRETVDVEAWQLYASGRYHVARRSEASVRRAIEYFSAAERVDPRFALASAGLSEAWAMMAVFGIEPPIPALEQARDAARRALDHEPDLPEGLIAMGQVVTQFDRALEDGREYYRRALQLRPDLSLAHAYMALSLTMGGRTSEALSAISRSQQLEPASPVFRSIGGFVSYFARDYAEAEQRLASVMRSVPEAPLPRQFLARVLVAQGRGAEVVALLDGRNEPAPGSYSTLGRALAQTGRRAEALEEVRKLEQLGERGFGVGFDLALLRLALGDLRGALDGLERAVTDHSQMGAYVMVEPALDPLRGDPRFDDLARRMFGT